MGGFPHHPPYDIAESLMDKANVILQQVHLNLVCGQLFNFGLCYEVLFYKLLMYINLKFLQNLILDSCLPAMESKIVSLSSDPLMRSFIVFIKNTVKLAIWQI